MFFSSVAHELRTPLNSIIPMSKILTSLIQDAKASRYLNIILNSAYHLQNVIEDALDMSRIENNKFEIISEFFDIRSVVEEVCQIMSFQVTSKSLSLSKTIDRSVPTMIKSDQKRYK